MLLDFREEEKKKPTLLLSTKEGTRLVPDYSGVTENKRFILDTRNRQPKLAYCWQIYQ